MIYLHPSPHSPRQNRNLLRRREALVPDGAGERQVVGELGTGLKGDPESAVVVDTPHSE